MIFPKIHNHHRDWVARMAPHRKILAMPRILSDEDVEAIALRLVQNVCARLMAEEKPREVQPPPPPPAPPEPKMTVQPKLAYTVSELSAELGISKPTIYRLVYRRLLKPLPYLRHKVFPRTEVERFLASGTDWNIAPHRGRRRA